MKPLHRSIATTLVLLATLHPAWMPQASAAQPAAALAAPVTAQAGAAPRVAETMTTPFGSDLAELSTPMKYGLLLIGLSLIEKLSRKERR